MARESNRDAIRAIRSLDVEWVQSQYEERFGEEVAPRIDERTGERVSAYEFSLICLHDLRRVYGTKRQKEESAEWLCARLRWSLEEPTYLH